MTTVTCPTSGCPNHGTGQPVAVFQVPGPVEVWVSPPAYCAACGALMTELVEEES